MFAPSKVIPVGLPPTWKVPSNAPSLARNSVTLSCPESVTQMLAPSKTRCRGLSPAGKVPGIVPSLACSLATLLVKGSATQMLAPSKARPRGLSASGKVWIDTFGAPGGCAGADTANKPLMPSKSMTGKAQETAPVTEGVAFGVLMDFMLELYTAGRLSVKAEISFRVKKLWAASMQAR